MLKRITIASVLGLAGLTVSSQAAAGQCQDCFPDNGGYECGSSPGGFEECYNNTHQNYCEGRGQCMHVEFAGQEEVDFYGEGWRVTGVWLSEGVLAERSCDGNQPQVHYTQEALRKRFEISQELVLR